MFIKIFCGDSQKYLLLQSNNVTINKKQVTITSDLFPMVCKYLEEVSAPVGEENMEIIDFIAKEYRERRKCLYSNEPENYEDQIPDIRDFFCALCPNTPYELIVPVLSAAEEGSKLLYEIKNAQKQEKPDYHGNLKISSVTVDENTYITSGPVFVMNDDGKTIDRI